MADDSRNLVSQKFDKHGDNFLKVLLLEDWCVVVAKLAKQLDRGQPYLWMHALQFLYCAVSERLHFLYMLHFIAHFRGDQQRSVLLPPILAQLQVFPEDGHKSGSDYLIADLHAQSLDRTHQITAGY